MNTTEHVIGVPADDAVAAQVQAHLAHDGVHAVACTFIDLSGVTRIKTIPLHRLTEVARYGVGMSYVSAVFTVDDQIATSPDYGSPVGDMRLRPDLHAAVALAHAPGWAWAPVNQDTQDLEPFPACPRHALTAQVEAAAARGVELQTAIEVEFSLLDDDGRPRYHGPGYGARALFDAGDFALELITTLEAQGLAVEQFHPEYSVSQYEVTIARDAPVATADRYALLRATIVGVARRHGCRVSFAPIAVANQVGNGAHVHLSAWRDGRDLFIDGDGTHGMAAEGEAFAAGLLDHLPEMSAVLTPSVLSYERLEPSHWSAPFTCWGPENREAAVRHVTGSAGRRSQSANIEVKPVDGASNPYLVLALVIAAGLDGIDRGLQLPEPVTVDPATLGDDERSARGIHRLPVDLDAAITRMEDSDLVRSALGEQLFEAHLAVRRLERDTFGSQELDAVIAAQRWRYG